MWDEAVEPDELEERVGDDSLLTKSNLTPEWRKKLKQSDFRDLESASGRISRRGDPEKCHDVDRVDDIAAGAAEIDRRRTLLHARGIRWPRGYRKIIEMWADGSGRVEIERALNVSQKRYYGAVEWAQKQLGTLETYGTQGSPEKNAKDLVAAMDPDSVVHFANLIESHMTQNQQVVPDSPILDAVQDAQDTWISYIKDLKEQLKKMNRLFTEEEARKLKLATEMIISIHAFDKRARKQEVEELTDEQLRAILAGDPEALEALGEGGQDIVPKKPKTKAKK